MLVEAHVVLLCMICQVCVWMVCPFVVAATHTTEGFSKAKDLELWL